jgi:hypothetical protein
MSPSLCISSLIQEATGTPMRQSRGNFRWRCWGYLDGFVPRRGNWIGGGRRNTDWFGWRCFRRRRRVRRFGIGIVRGWRRIVRIRCGRIHFQFSLVYRVLLINPQVRHLFLAICGLPSRKALDSSSPTGMGGLPCRAQRCRIGKSSTGKLSNQSRSSSLVRRQAQ